MVHKAHSPFSNKTAAHKTEHFEIKDTITKKKLFPPKKLFSTNMHGIWRDLQNTFFKMEKKDRNTTF